MRCPYCKQEVAPLEETASLFVHVLEDACPRTVLSSDELANGLDAAPGGGRLGPGELARARGSLGLFDEIDPLLAARISRHYGYGVLFESASDGAGRASGAVEKLPTGPLTGLEQVDDNGRLPSALPEPARLAVRRGREPDGDEFLNAAPEPFGIGCDAAAGLGVFPDAAADEQAHGANGAEGAQGASPRHSKSVPQMIRETPIWPPDCWIEPSNLLGKPPLKGSLREMLTEWRGRDDARRWIRIDDSKDPIVIETCFLPPDVAARLGSGWKSNGQGGYRYELHLDRPGMPLSLDIVRIFTQLGVAFGSVYEGDDWPEEE